DRLQHDVVTAAAAPVLLVDVEGLLAGDPGQAAPAERDGHDAVALQAEAQLLDGEAPEQADLVLGERLPGTARVDAGEVQDLGPVDVADAGDHRLVEEQ